MHGTLTIDSYCADVNVYDLKPLDFCRLRTWEINAVSIFFPMKRADDPAEAEIPQPDNKKTKKDAQVIQDEDRSPSQQIENVTAEELAEMNYELNNGNNLIFWQLNMGSKYFILQDFIM